MPSEDYRNLHLFARSRGLCDSELARQILHDGTRRMLDPDEINRQFDRELAARLEGAERIREEFGVVLAADVSSE